MIAAPRSWNLLPGCLGGSAGFPCHDPVEIRVISEGVSRFPGTVLDVSRSGLRLELATSLTKGSEVEVSVRGHVLIFGEVRYCHRTGDSVHAGILIREVLYSRPPAVDHVHDDELSLYLVRKGLTLPDLIRVRDHLAKCETCQIRLGEADAILRPIRKRKFLGTLEP
jgi:PilZ domain-containing protein